MSEKPGSSQELYRQIFVWRRPSPTTLDAYICFERLSDGMFCIQSLEFFQRSSGKTQFDRLIGNLTEFLFDEDLAKRCKFFPGLREAIAAHDADFADLPEP